MRDPTRWAIEEIASLCWRRAEEKTDAYNRNRRTDPATLPEGVTLADEEEGIERLWREAAQLAGLARMLREKDYGPPDGMQSVLVRPVVAELARVLVQYLAIPTGRETHAECPTCGKRSVRFGSLDDAPRNERTCGGRIGKWHPVVSLVVAEP